MSDSDSDVETKLSKLSINKKENNMLTDLQVAAEAARMSSESELDSDDLSSEDSD